MTTTRARNFTNGFSVLLVLSFVVAFLSATTVGAKAADGLPPSAGGTISTGGGIDKGSAHGGHSSGGGSVSADPGWHWSSGGYTCPAKGICGFNWGSSAGEGGYVHKSASCMARSADGDRLKDWRPVSIQYSYQTRNDPTQSPHEKGWSYNCIFPPPPQSRPIVCSLSATGRVGRVQITAATLANKTVYSPWASDRANAAKCPALTSVAVNASLSTLGAFQVNLKAVSVPCTLRTTFGPNGGSRIIRCGAPLTKTLSTKPEQWCDGKVHYTANAGWNHAGQYGFSGCAGDSGQLIRCAWAGKSTYDGKALPGVHVLDDGKARVLKMQTFKPSGPIVSISNIRSGVIYQGGSPRRPGSTIDEINSDDQPVLLDGGHTKFAQDIYSGFTSGDRTRWTLGFMSAGVPGSDFTIAKKVRFDAVIRTQMTTITSIDLDGTVHTKTTKVNVQANNMSCTGPDVSIAVDRARNSSN